MFVLIATLGRRVRYDDDPLPAIRGAVLKSV